MTADRTLPPTRRLSVRLAVAFLATSLGALGLFAAVAFRTSREGVTALAMAQREDKTDQAAAVLETAYEQVGGWRDADLLPAHTLAAAAGATLLVVDQEGKELPVPAEAEHYRSQMRVRTPAADEHAPAHDDEGQPAPGTGHRGTDGTQPGDHDPAPHSPHRSDADASRDARREPAADPAASGPSTVAVRLAATGDGDVPSQERDPAAVRLERDVVVDGRRVGLAVLLFSREPLDSNQARLRDAMTENLATGIVAAVLLALVATAFVAPRLTRPLRRLTTAVTAVAAGDRSPRDRLSEAPGELGTLGAAVSEMARQLDRAEQLRRSLVADVAHELRTPLSILQGELEAIVDGVFTPDAARLASLRDEVLRLSRLVDDLGVLATSEAAGLTLQPETSALDEVLADTAAALRPRIEGQGLHLELQLQPVTADVDRTRVYQMVANLLGNAAKYAGEAGTVTLGLRAEGADAVIDVIDDGPGIPADELPHVFDRFWRGSTATGTSGTGIGLAVVAAIAEAHQGRTHASREPGRGSRFTVTLPLSRDLHPVSTHTPSDLHAASQD